MFHLFFSHAHLNFFVMHFHAKDTERSGGWDFIFVVFDRQSLIERKLVNGNIVAKKTLKFENSFALYVRGEKEVFNFSLLPKACYDEDTCNYIKITTFRSHKHY